MTEKKKASAEPVSAEVVFSIERDGHGYPALIIKGDAPRKGSTLRVKLPNGVIYTAKAHSVTESDEGHLVETDGLTSED